MAWKKVLVRTKPDSDTAFEKISAEVQAYMITNYDDTGKRTSHGVTVSDDGLVTTHTNIFKDEASKNKFLADSTIAAESNRRNAINANNNITTETIADEEV